LNVIPRASTVIPHLMRDLINDADVLVKRLGSSARLHAHLFFIDSITVLTDMLCKFMVVQYTACGFMSKGDVNHLQ
jgi:hypothetical protein